MSQLLAQITNPQIPPELGYGGQANSTNNLIAIRDKILTLVMPLAAIALLLYLIWGAFDWITSGGDNSKVQNARNKMINAVLGMFVLASVFAILQIIDALFGTEFNSLLNPWA